MAELNDATEKKEKEPITKENSKSQKTKSPLLISLSMFCAYAAFAILAAALWNGTDFLITKFITKEVYQNSVEECAIAIATCAFLMTYIMFKKQNPEPPGKKKDAEEKINNNRAAC